MVVDIHSFVQSLTQNVRQHPIVWVIIAVSIFPFVCLQWLGVSSIAGWFMPVSLGELTSSQEWWRLITPIFIHYTTIHLLVNLYLWWLFACMLERSSPRLLLTLLIVCAVTTNLCQFLVSGPKFGGMSGVVYGLFGFIGLVAKLQPERGFSIDRTITIGLLLVLVIAATGLVGRYSDAAHLCGLIMGLSGAFIYTRRFHSNA
jgi:rhomboid protease GlpG